MSNPRKGRHYRPPDGCELWFPDAAARTEVILPDGREGVLVGITAHSLTAKVRHRNRFERHPLTDLKRRPT
jgi:hypothetical protein